VLTDQQLQEGCVEVGDFVVSALEVHVNCQCLSDDVWEQVVDLLAQKRLIFSQQLYELRLKIDSLFNYSQYTQLLNLLQFLCRRWDVPEAFR
jgi:hypothetical protein